ncbi:hypothetical protein KCP73_04265 [Salmonella enterica subsp. enterica]|nr:hypothetical protein KCP73_04265 [Salmonella enterica subsp. enterica]
MKNWAHWDIVRNGIVIVIQTVTRSYPQLPSPPRCDIILSLFSFSTEMFCIDKILVRQPWPSARSTSRITLPICAMKTAMMKSGWLSITRCLPAPRR